MTRFTLVVFPDEGSALQGYDALEKLHRLRTLSVVGAVLVDRDDDGLLSLRKETLGTLLGSSLSAVVARVPSDMLEFLVRDLAPGTFALVAELCGERSPEIDARMEWLGGRVVRDSDAELARRHA
jgi:hypothetical protein